MGDRNPSRLRGWSAGGTGVVALWSVLLPQPGQHRDWHLYGERLEALWSSRHELGTTGHGFALQAIGMDPGAGTGLAFARTRFHGGRQFQDASPQASENGGAILIRSFHRRRLRRQVYRIVGSRDPTIPIGRCG